MRFRAAASVAFAFLFPVSQAAFSQQVAKVRVQTPVTGSAGVLAGASYNAAASVHAQPLVGGALHGLPTQIGAIPTLSHPVLQAVPAANAFPEGQPGRSGSALDRVPAAEQPVAVVGTREPARGSQTPAPSGPELKLPKGAKSVTLHEARTAADVDRLIPVNSNSINLIAQLKNAIRTYGPVKIRDYEDSIGGHFVAIDLAGQARWLDRIPELQPHEVYLIRKILKVTPDVQVVVREEGKTPDLVVAGDMTEIKSDFKGLPSAHLLDKANQQVREFAQRHMLEGGNLAMDLVNEPSVETQRVLEAVNNWAQAARRVDLGRIMMFAGDDVKHFALGSDGVFRLAEEASPGLVVDAGVEVRRAQMLAKKGMLGKAHDVLKRVMPDQAELAVDPYAPATQARESLEAERALLKIKKLARTQPAKARETWRRFRKNHSEEVVLKISAEVDNALGVVSVPRSASISLPADPGGLAREVSEPAKILRDHGVRATVTVYGSARILPQHVALKRYKKAAALWGENPAAEEGKAAMETARRDLENSRWYEEARRFGRLVAKGSGGTLAVVTGGGPGIMEAANRGAFEAGGPSVGYNIALPKEQGLNPYVTPGLSFEFGNFSTRKMNLRHGAAAYVFFPGGFGTMDELFETLTLMQTGKIARVPIVLVGEKAYWQKVVGFQAFADMGLIAQADLGIFRFAETAEAAWDFVSETLTAASPSFQTVQSF